MQNAPHLFELLTVQESPLPTIDVRPLLALLAHHRS